MPVKLPNNPSISNVRAIITSRWGKSGYRPTTFRNLETYFIDTALDNDADSWEVTLADPHGKYLELLERDAEIRMQLFGVGQQGADFLMTGVADDATYDQDGTITLTGRDYSSLATDSTVPPKRYRKKTGWSIVEQQAKELGFQKRTLSHRGRIHNNLVTDGSESYWEFWYRLYRKDQMYLWCEPNGRLMASTLNYSEHPVYFFGTPHQHDPAQVKRNYLRIERIELHKSTQSRVHEVWVFGQKGEIGFLERVTDPSIKLWIKKPRKILYNDAVSSVKGARKAGFEEIFEGKVGAMELRITVQDPGVVIRQNRIARVNIPEIGLAGEYFIVGSRIQCSTDGFLQEIRLRQKQYAITRRLPDDPKLTTHHAPQRESVLTGLGAAIAATGNMPEEWGMYFVNAAKQWHGPWDFDLFLATLIGICDQESSFRNVREGGGPEWFPPPGSTPQEAHHHGEERARMSLDEWHQLFANAAGNPYNPFRSRGVNAEAGVGPMQLTSAGLKHYADDNFRPANRDEYVGGRWHTEHNIWGAARYLRECLKSVVRDSGRDQDIWMGVSAYNHGVGGATVGDAYSVSVKNKVLRTPGYLQAVTSAVQNAREAAKAARDDQTDPWTDEAAQPRELPTREQCIAFWNHYNNAFFSTALSKRQAIVNAAMWGKYNRSEMNYVSNMHSSSHLSQRLTDFAPPLNIPNYTDCSGFAGWCYKSARANDPSQTNWSNIWTGTLWSHGTAVTVANLEAGDLVFYGNPASTSGHVAVYVGFGKVVSFGSPGGPWIVDLKYRSDFAGCRRYAL